MQLLNRLLVEAQILLAANKDDGKALAEMKDLGDPLERAVSDQSHVLVTRASYLLLDVVERVRRVDGKADEDDVRVGVGERAETVVILLAGSIPEGELDVLAVDLDVGDVVFEDGGDVDLQRASSQYVHMHEHEHVHVHGRVSLGGWGVRCKRCWPAGLTQLRDGGRGGARRELTSGKVPLEKTLQTGGLAGGQRQMQQRGRGELVRT